MGGYIALAGLWGAPLSGASMNPARTFGPNLVGGDLSLNPSQLAALDERITFVIRDSGLPQGSPCGAPRIPSFSPLAEPIIHDLPTDSG